MVKLMSFGLTMLAAASVWAAPIVGGLDSFSSVAGSAGTVVTQAEMVAVSPAANGLVKTGEGTYVLPSDTLALRDTFSIKTGAGANEFRFVTSSAAFAYPLPSVMSNAAFWVDASRDNAFATSVTTNVVSNGDGSAADYPDYFYGPGSLTVSCPVKGSAIVFS